MDDAAIQRALTAHGHPLTADGIKGPLSSAAIAAFQLRKGLVFDVGERTLAALAEPPQGSRAKALLLAVAPRFTGAKAVRQAEIIDQVAPVFFATLDRYAITGRLRVAHFVAQVCHESAGFRTTEEFASGDAYEGRLDLGNTERGDGRRFKGRGLLQLTGRANYREYGAAFGIDLEAEPARAAEPELSLAIACEYWARRRINEPADRDDIPAVTRRVNGGLNGLADRRVLLTKAKAAIPA